MPVSSWSDLLGFNQDQWQTAKELFATNCQEFNRKLSTPTHAEWSQAMNMSTVCVHIKAEALKTFE